MSRITTKQYFNRHFFLFAIWHGKLQSLFATISIHAQTDLHRYYQPSLQLGDDELLANRDRAVTRDPSLPQRAGKAFAHLQAAYVQVTEVLDANGELDLLAVHRAIKPYLRSSNVSTSGKHRIRVTGIVKPEKGLERIARAVLELYRLLTPEERAALDERRTRKAVA